MQSHRNNLKKDLDVQERGSVHSLGSAEWPGLQNNQLIGSSSEMHSNSNSQYRGAIHQSFQQSVPNIPLSIESQQLPNQQVSTTSQNDLVNPQFRDSHFQKVGHTSTGVSSANMPVGYSHHQLMVMNSRINQTGNRQGVAPGSSHPSLVPPPDSSIHNHNNEQQIHLKKQILASTNHQTVAQSDSEPDHHQFLQQRLNINQTAKHELLSRGFNQNGHAAANGRGPHQYLGSSQGGRAHGSKTPCLLEAQEEQIRGRDRAASGGQMQQRDAKMLQMIVGTITPDGVLNLQAKSIMQQPKAVGNGLLIYPNSNGDDVIISEDKDASVDSMATNQNDRSLDLANIFGGRALRYARLSGPAMLQGLQSIVKLNLSSNKIQTIDDDFCECLPNLQVLDLRANKIEEISAQIRQIQHLKVLKLDKNELVSLPDEIFEIGSLRELTFQQNRISYLSDKIGGLRHLKKLNIASNVISTIPQSIGQCQELETLCIQNNRFASFPCSFLQLTNLRELSLEWFIYAKPPKPQYISRKTRDGQQIFESLMVLCNLLQKYKMNECALITFLENYSDDNFDKNQRDNRQRTPLHKAAVMGDTGVIDGLLMDKANTDLLDKDSCTPLCLAIRQENYEAAQSLIEFGADVNIGGGIFGSPVHLSVVRLKVPIIQSLIDKKADLNKQDSDGNTPLHIVMNIFSKNPERCCHILELLALNGARINQKNHDHWAPLHTAVRKGQEKGVNAIIQLNQMLNERNLTPFDLNITGGVQQWSSLHLAAHASQLQIIIDLTRAGADIFQRNHTNQLPRHCAKGNYIMTKNIKHIEQRYLAQRFDLYQLIEAALAGVTSRELLRQVDRFGITVSSGHSLMSGNHSGGLGSSSMSFKELRSDQQATDQQMKGGKDGKNVPLGQYLAERLYQCFTHHLQMAKRMKQGAVPHGGQGPITHLKSQAPISRKHMTQGGEAALEDSDDDVHDGVDDFPAPLRSSMPQRSANESNKVKFKERKRQPQFASQPSALDLGRQNLDAQPQFMQYQGAQNNRGGDPLADNTIKANDNDSETDLRSLDAEYDVVEEENEAALSRHIQQNIIGERYYKKIEANKSMNSQHGPNQNNSVQSPHHREMREKHLHSHNSSQVLSSQMINQPNQTYQSQVVKSTMNGKSADNSSLFHHKMNSSSIYMVSQCHQDPQSVSAIEHANLNYSLVVEEIVKMRKEAAAVAKQGSDDQANGSEVSKSQVSQSANPTLHQLQGLNRIRNLRKPQDILTLLPLLQPPNFFCQLDNFVLQSDILHGIQAALCSCSQQSIPEMAHLSAVQHAVNQLIEMENGQLYPDIIDRLCETLEIIDGLKKVGISRKASLPTVRKGPSLKIPSHSPMVLAVRHPSPSQHQMEGGQSHQVHPSSHGLQNYLRQNLQKQQIVSATGALGKRKQTHVQSFNGGPGTAPVRMVAPMQLLSACDGHEANVSSSRILTSGCNQMRQDLKSEAVRKETAQGLVSPLGSANQVSYVVQQQRPLHPAKPSSQEQYFALKQNPESPAIGSGQGEVCAPDLDDTVRQSKSFIEGDDLQEDDQIQQRDPSNQVASRTQYSDVNLIKGVTNVSEEHDDGVDAQKEEQTVQKQPEDFVAPVHPISQTEERENSTGAPNGHPKQSARTRFQKVLNDINQHNKSSHRDSSNKLQSNSLSTYNKQLVAAKNRNINSQNKSGLRPKNKQRVLNSLGEQSCYSSSVVMNDKLPSSPQSINIFNNNIAKNIHQLGQRMQQREEEEGAHTMISQKLSQSSELHSRSMHQSNQITERSRKELQSPNSISHLNIDHDQGQNALIHNQIQIENQGPTSQRSVQNPPGAATTKKSSNHLSKKASPKHFGVTQKEYPVIPASKLKQTNSKKTVRKSTTINLNAISTVHHPKDRHLSSLSRGKHQAMLTPPSSDPPPLSTHATHKLGKKNQRV